MRYFDTIYSVWVQYKDKLIRTTKMGAKLSSNNVQDLKQLAIHTKDKIVN